MPGTMSAKLMRDGFAPEVGNHKQLMQRKGHYMELMNNQMGTTDSSPEKAELVVSETINQ
jgi:hypothetical protein